jgi:DNA-binding MarR family transcriptional regulator
MAGYDDCIVFLLAKAHQKAQAVSKRGLKSYGLTPIQRLIIEALREEDQVTATDIVNRLILDHATVSDVLERMEEGGWIAKEIDPDDKRSLRISLSDKARQMSPSLIKERESVNQEILAGLTLEEKVLLKRLLRTIRE